MIADIIILALGIAILILGANWLVEGASSVAAKLGVSTFVVGLTVVAFGTSLPELVVNVMASLRGSSGLAIGNVVGSNTINILFIVGITAIIKPVNIRSTTVRIEIPFSLLAAVVLLIMANKTLLDSSSHSSLTRTDGLVLITFLIVFLYYTFLSAKSDKHAPVADVKFRKNYISALMIAASIAGLYFGGKLIVDSATKIAQELGVSDALIGLTVLAIGTSLPELVTSVVAATKGNSDIAIGNVLGSNIFNIFMVLGISSAIIPLPLYPGANLDILITCIASIMLFAFALIGPGQKIDQREGWLFVALYFGYIIYLIAQS